MQNYLLLALVGFCVISHIWMLRRGHGACEEKKEKVGAEGDKGDHSCCH